MNYGFIWTEKSQARNAITFTYEPLQPLLLLEFSNQIGATIFFDVGANIGFYSLAMTLLPSIKTIHSFEASEETFSVLINNVEMNSFGEKINCVNKAVSSSSGYVDFQIESPLSGINSIAETSFHNKSLFNNTQMVASCSLDDFCSVSGDVVSLKIDVEGHEAHVLTGAENLLRNNACVVQIEIYSDTDNAAVGFLEELGYQRVFRAKNDFYFSNSDKLQSPFAIIDSVERAVEKFINLNMGKWPPARLAGGLDVSSCFEGDTLIASCRPNLSMFKEPLEYAFYIYSGREKIQTVWYTDNSRLEYCLPDSGNGNEISVSCFVREKNSPEKKLMVNVKVPRDGMHCQ